MCEDTNVMPERAEPSLGYRIGEKYEIVERLGSGTFGNVYKVRSLISTNPGTYALKILKLWEYDRKGQENMNKRFKLEYEAGKIPSDYLVKSRETGCFKGNPYIVMEYCPNGTLRDKINQRLNEPEIKRFAEQILHGLGDLHKSGRCHRDLKPENVLLDSYNRAKLTDFGIAGHANVVLTKMSWMGRPQQQLGTYLYMPTEQINPRYRNETILPTIDIFAFGVVCYEMFTKRYPFGPMDGDGDMENYLRRVKDGDWDDPRKHNRDIPAYWIEILKYCLERDYTKRFQNVDAILKTLNAKPHEATSERPITSNSKWGVKIMHGEQFGREYDLDKLNNYKHIGVLNLGWYDATGNVTNDIAIKEELTAYISRRHATFERDHDGWYIRDGQQSGADWSSSKNGTYINNQELNAVQRKKIQFNDIITVGYTTLKVIPM